MSYEAFVNFHHSSSPFHYSISLFQSTIPPNVDTLVIATTTSYHHYHYYHCYQHHHC